MLKKRQENLHTVTILINRDNGWKTFPCFSQPNSEIFVFSSFLGTCLHAKQGQSVASLLLFPGADLDMLFILSQEKHVNMIHIESRKSRRRSSEVEIFVDCECGKTEFNELIQSLKFQTTIVTLNPPENIWTEEEGKASFCLLGDFAS